MSGCPNPRRHLRRPILGRAYCIIAILALFVAGCGGSPPDAPRMQPLAAVSAGMLSDGVVTDSARVRLLLDEAERLIRDAGYDSALVRVEAAERLFTAGDTGAVRLRAALYRGRAWYQSGRYDDALAVLDMAIDGTPGARSAHALLVADGYDVMGNIQRSVGEMEAAERRFLDAYALRRERLGEESRITAKSLHNLGTLYHTQGRYDQAKEYYLRRLEVEGRIEHPDSLSLSNTFHNLGLLYRSTGDFEDAQASLQQGLAIRLGNLQYAHPLVASSYNGLAILHELLGDFENARRYYNRAISIRETLFGALHPDVAGDYFNLGDMELKSNNLGAAGLYFEKALASFAQSDVRQHPLLAFIHLGMGTLATAQGAFDEGSAHLQKSLALNRAMYGDGHPQVVLLYRKIGALYEKKEAWAEALSYYRTADELVRAHHPGNLESHALGALNRGNVYRAMGELSLAHEAFQQAARTLEAGNAARETLVRAYNALARLSLDAGHARAALSWLERAGDANRAPPLVSDEAGSDAFVSEAEMVSTLVLTTRAYLQRYGTTGSTYDLARGLDAATEAGQISQRYLRTLRSEDSRLFWAEHVADLYEPAIATSLALFRTTGEPSYRDAAFAFAEQSRGGVLSQAMQETHARRFAGLPPSLQEEEEALRIRLTYYSGKLKDERRKGGEADSARVHRWQERMFDLSRRHDALLDSLEQHYPDYFRLKHATRAASPAGVQHALAGTHDTLVQYFSGADSLYAFIMDAARFTVVAMPADSSLERTAGLLRTAILDHDTPRYLDAARRLYRHAFAPVTPHVRGERIVVVPDGPLSYVPFEVLLTEDVPLERREPLSYAGLPYLLHRHAVSYAYSSTLLLATLDRPSTARGQFVAFAPVFADGLAAGTRGEGLVDANLGTAAAGVSRAFLPATYDEVMGIDALFAGRRGWMGRLLGARTRVFLEDEASEANVHAALAEYRYVHLATHAFVNETDPLQSGIVLHDDTTGGYDGVLDLAEIYNLSINAELVTLSACQTGLGRFARGEGLIGLTRGFLFAGARNVAVSLWNVQDQATSRLMQQFYEGILEGRPNPEALRDAKRRLILTTDTFAHPFYWSAFVLHGR